MKEEKEIVLRNEDVQAVIVEVPKGHRHLRTTLVLANGSYLTLQEATVANIVRAYITLKTHPQKERVVLVGQRVSFRKDGYAEWQLLEAEAPNAPDDTAQKPQDG